MKKLERILSIDCGKDSGWAYNDLQGQIYSGCRSFRNHERINDVNLRFGMDGVEYWEWLNTMIVSKKIDRVVTEQWFQYGNAPVNVQSSRWLSLTHNDLIKAAAFNRIPYEEVPLQRWRGDFCDVRSIPKDELNRFQAKTSTSKNPDNMRRQMSSKWWKDKVKAKCDELGHGTIRSHNQCDAIGILYYFLRRDFTQFGESQMELFR